jgi:hypothetical protein
MSKRNRPKGKRINPTYWIFCEGQTEVAYISFLRSKYRLPIEINSKIGGLDINESFIQKSKQGKPVDIKDKDFLMYDGDTPEIIKQLQKISTATMIVSNPSIELWFLYHYKDQKAILKSSDCTKELSNRNRKEYKKGVIDDKLMVKLNENCKKACERAKNSNHYKNPSSNLHILIEELEKIKKEK